MCFKSSQNKSLLNSRITSCRRVMILKLFWVHFCGNFFGLHCMLKCQPMVELVSWNFKQKHLTLTPIPSLWLKLNSWPCLLTNNNNALRMNSVKSDCKILVTVLSILLTILEYMYVRVPTVCSLLGWLLHELWTNVDNIIAPDCPLTTLMTTLCRGCISRSLDIDNWRALNAVVPYTLQYKISFDFNEYRIFTT